MGLFDLISDALGFKRREAKILVIGLDNSGKTTLINHLKPKKASTFEVTPTVGFQVEELKKNNINFTIFDMSGQGRYRTLWEHYYQDAEVRYFYLNDLNYFIFLFSLSLSIFYITPNRQLSLYWIAQIV